MQLLGLKETKPLWDSEEGPVFALIFMAPEGSGRSDPIELTYNWDGDDALPSDSRHFGHLAYGVDNIYETCAHLEANGVTINRPPRDGRMAFVRSPDNISIELLQNGDVAGHPPSPWLSMGNTGQLVMLHGRIMYALDLHDPFRACDQLRCCHGSAQAETCRLALVLALDVSSSVNVTEDALQRGGLARSAWSRPRLKRQSLSGDPIAIAVYEWSGRHNQRNPRLLAGDSQSER